MRFSPGGSGVAAVRELEQLGYSALWVPGGIDDQMLVALEPMLDATSTMRLCTGIINIWKQEAAGVAAWSRARPPAQQDRLMLGVGVSHGPLIGGAYAKPFTKTLHYIDALEQAGMAMDHVCIGANGPRMLALAAERTAGAHPYLVTARHTDAVGAISRDAAARGIRIVMESVPDTGIPDIAAAAAIVDGVAMANCGILLDPWHLSRSGGTLTDITALPPRAIGAFQLDDRTPPPPGTPYVPMTGRDLPGEGALPLIELTRAALANNPDLTAEVEVFSEALRQLSPDAAAARVKDAVGRWRAGLCADGDSSP